MNDQNITKHLKFPFTYDEKALIHDLSIILQDKWIPHFNTTGYEGDWTVIPLYAKSGNESNIFALSMDDSTVVETPIMNDCLYFKKVIASFKFPILSARLLKLGVGASIKPHCDHNLGYEDNCFRLHIPIITNDNVNFILDGNQLRMLPGECWYTNVNYTHSVVNNGTTDRVHMVIDGERNDWSDDLFFSLAPKESFFPNKEVIHDTETLKRIIEELKHSDLPAAKELIIANELLLLKQIAKVEALQKLKKISGIIIKQEVVYLELKGALEELKHLMLNISGLDFEANENQEHIYLNSGMAIGPKWAGMCIDDLMRTKRFICGIHKAVQHLRQTKKDKPIQILYCGTGPFATLVLPLTTLYEPNEIQLVLLEVNPISLKSLKNCISELNADNYISGIYQGDGAKFKVPSASDIDIVIIECLQHALNHEPQAAITFNLIPQLREDVILIPEEINLHVSLSNSKLKAQNLEYLEGAEPLSFYKHYDPVFTLNKIEVLKRMIALNGDAMNFPVIKMLFSKEDTEHYDEIAIATEIKIFASEKLSMNESGLTIPKILGYFDDDNSIMGIKTQYLANEDPQLKTEFIRES